ncbi:hypothetical protein [Nannocystis radixulma]|uniref:Uncharacterized protein n=1 Tax=Nannocystis radixulma TaxID=2995305 RepID=A0ABT5BQZ3_9BACT|nr:hypothetical protein [Nannocystis radixulma]MDC0675412.1 hypothetical protein [Nannocystis radixulma]
MRLCPERKTRAYCRSLQPGSTGGSPVVSSGPVLVPGAVVAAVGSTLVPPVGSTVPVVGAAVVSSVLDPTVLSLPPVGSPPVGALPVGAPVEPVVSPAPSPGQPASVVHTARPRIRRRG